MAKIDRYIEERIKNELSVIDALQEIGENPIRRGSSYECRNPFRDDNNPGSFKVNIRENYVKDFATGDNGFGKKTYSAIDILMQGLGLSYHDALKHGAAMLNIYIDDSEPVKVQKVSIPRSPVPKQDIIRFSPKEIATPYRKFNDKNPLLSYLRELPMLQAHKEGLEDAIKNYAIGTYPSGYHEGWTIWWLVDNFGYLRSGKMMKYKTDGHRDKSTNATWVHTMLAKVGYYNPDTHIPDLCCLFGQHLIDLCPKAVVRIVESEKTAVICSSFVKPQQAIWLATGGMQRLNDRMLQVLMDKGRYIELYPDYDGYPDWEKKVEDNPQMRAYRDKGMLVVSDMVRNLWKPEDGPKADIADIMIRIVTTLVKTEAEKTYEMACAKLGVQQHEPLRELIKSFELKIEN